MLQRLLALLLALFSLPVVDGDPDGGAGGDDGGDAGGDGASASGADDDGPGDDDEDDDTLEALLDRQGTDVPEGADKALDKGGKKETPSERQEAKLLRESIETSRETRRLIESRLPPQTQQQDPQEQADLQAIQDARASGDETKVRGAEWAYNTNRINRENQRKADMALFLAQESDDKSSFREMGREDPKMFKRYKDKVESKLAELRSQGRSLPRITLYDYLVGKDIREARANGGIKTRKTSAGADGVQRADRGRTPGARSDVSGRGNGRLTKKAELEKRLSNVRI